MTVSDNGYVVDKSLWVRVRVPGTNVTLGVRRGAVATVLTQAAAWFDQYVEDIDTAAHPGSVPRPTIRGAEPSKVADDWGPNIRKIRGAQKTISNHASGTAFDLNATQHPMGVKGTFTPEQIRNMDRIVAWLLGCIRWGEHYHTRVDGMHIEINAPESVVKKAAAKIEAWRAGRIPGPFDRVAAAPKPTPAPVQPEVSLEDIVTKMPVVKHGSKGTPVRVLQGLLLARAIGVGKHGIDGDAGDDTIAGVNAWKRHVGLPANGVVDSRTWKSLFTGAR